MGTLGTLGAAVFLVAVTAGAAASASLGSRFLFTAPWDLAAGFCFPLGLGLCSGLAIDTFAGDLCASLDAGVAG